MSVVEKISPVFQSTGKENVPLVDVYDKNDLEIKNSLVSKVTGLSKEAMSTIRNNPELLTKAGGILMSYSKGDFDLSLKGAMSLVDSTDFGKKLKGLTSGFGDKIKGSLEAGFKAIKIDPQKALGAISNIGGVISHLPLGGLIDDPAIGSFLSKVAVNASNNPLLVNLDWESNVITSTGKLLLENGGSDILEQLIEDYKTDYTNKEMPDVANTILVRATKNLLPDIVKTGNLKNIEKALRRLSRNDILNEYPDIKKEILENYVIPKKTKPENYINQLTLLETIMELIDTGWYKFNSKRVDYRLEDDEVVPFLDTRMRFDLTPFLEINDDARTILEVDPANKYGMALSLSREFEFRDLDAKQEMSTMFPQLVIMEQ